MEAGQPRVAVEDVTVRFDGTLALDGLSLEIGRSEFVAIVGPSGSGKSTLFNVVSGLVRPTSGRVLLDGRDATGETGHVGYMLQTDLLIPWRTVVGTSCSAPRSPARRAATARRRPSSPPATASRVPRRLSARALGRMRQRVALMRTLALHTDVLLLDEPFGALDSQTRLEMQLWLLSVYEDVEATILFVTHDVDEAILLADRVAVMSGRPVDPRRPADPAAAAARPRSPDLARLHELKRDVLRLLHEPVAAVPS